MADALAVVHMRQLLVARPVAGDAHDAARVVVAFGNVVIDHEHDARAVPDLRAQRLEHRLEAARA
ncbi:hypothetical protein ET532_027040 [Verminephrobacter sp. Larva24]|nr:hypothetical protein ET532_027040 [Verminephrobacter sp. Larva24]